MLKYYVLVSKSMNCLCRQFNSLKRQETVVVINTLDEEFKQQAVAWCTKNDIEFYITKSDGTAATGKNSVIDLFLESDNEYMVHVDGDDVITKFGRNLYRAIAEQSYVPDCIALYKQAMVNRYDIVQPLFDTQVDTDTVDVEAVWNHQNCHFPHAYEIGEKPDNVLNNSQLIKHIDVYMDRYKMTRQKAEYTSYVRLWLEQLYIDYGDGNETFNRMVFFSRKAAAWLYYDNNYKIGEDTICYYQMKKYATDGHFNMEIRSEKQGFTYLYMSDYDGIISRKDIDKQGEEALQNYWDWMEPLLIRLKQVVRGISKYTRLNEYKDPFYEVNKK